MTPGEFLDHLSWLVSLAGSQKAFAERHDISEQYLCDVLKGRREPGKKILDAVGFQRVVIYVERNHEMLTEAEYKAQQETPK